VRPGHDLGARQSSRFRSARACRREPVVSRERPYFGLGAERCRDDGVGGRAERASDDDLPRHEKEEDDVWTRDAVEGLRSSKGPSAGRCEAGRRAAKQQRTLIASRRACPLKDP